jgi:hypothetical protein
MPNADASTSTGTVLLLAGSSSSTRWKYQLVLLVLCCCLAACRRLYPGGTSTCTGTGRTATSTLRGSCYYRLPVQITSAGAGTLAVWYKLYTPLCAGDVLLHGAWNMQYVVVQQHTCEVAINNVRVSGEKT